MHSFHLAKVAAAITANTVLAGQFSSAIWQTQEQGWQQYVSEFPGATLHGSANVILVFSHVFQPRNQGLYLQLTVRTKFASSRFAVEKLAGVKWQLSTMGT